MDERRVHLKQVIESLEQTIAAPPKDGLTVHLGLDYFAQLSGEKLLEFLNRRLSQTQQEYEMLCQFAGTNEEGLPIMDIVEELDEDGNIIRSNMDTHTCEPEGVEEPMETNKTGDESPFSSAKEDLNPENESIEKPESDDLNLADDEPRIVEIKDDDQNEDEEEVSSIDPISLELDLGDSDDQDVVDYDFDDLEEEEEDEEEDSGEDDEYYSKPTRGSLFPQNYQTVKLIQAQMADKLKEEEISEQMYASSNGTETQQPKTQQQLKPEPKVVSKPSNLKKPNTKNEAKPKKGVKFSENVDVREFETSRLERVSNSVFKEAMAAKPPRRTLRQSKPGKTSASAAAAAAAAIVTNNHNPIQYNVTERKPQPANPSPRPPRAKPGTQPATFLRKSRTPHVAQKPTVKQIATSQNADKQDRTDPKPDPKTQLNGNDLKNQVKTDTQEIFENSFIPDNDFLDIHDQSQTDEMEVKEEKVDNKPILTEVCEKMDDLEIENGDSDEDNTPNMLEIKHEYQRLRQKLIYDNGGYIEKPDEKEVEVEKPKKVSRFKAARI